MKLNIAVLGVLLALTAAGCASAHRQITTKPTAPCNAQGSNAPCLEPPHWVCGGTNDSCYLAQTWNPPQLTPFGCAAHTVVTFGHVAQECRKNADHGRWLWRGDKKGKGKK